MTGKADDKKGEDIYPVGSDFEMGQPDFTTRLRIVEHIFEEVLKTLGGKKKWRRTFMGYKLENVSIVEGEREFLPEKTKKDLRYLSISKKSFQQYLEKGLIRKR